MATEDSVESLKRELDLLRTQINKERKQKPLKSVLGEFQESRASFEEKRFTKSSLSHGLNYAIENGLLLPIDSRRGKWILHDRQVLSKSETNEEIALKVRETWSWCGRTIVVDKIVPILLNEDQKEEKNMAVKEDKQSDKTSNNLVHEGILKEEFHEVRAPLYAISSEKPVQLAATPSSTENSPLKKEKESSYQEKEDIVVKKAVVTEEIAKPVANDVSKKAELEAKILALGLDMSDENTVEEKAK